MSSLDGMTAIVTGSSRGIGRAIALALARDGADVAVTYHERRTAGEETAREIVALGRRSFAAELDVASRSSIRRLVTDTCDRLGKIDILVNNAGILEPRPFGELSDEDWDRTLAINLKSVFMFSQEVFPVMERHGGGAIINIASVGGQFGGTRAVHYAASKAGIICLSKSLAKIGAPRIRVNCIAPGLIDTEMVHSDLGTPWGIKLTQEIPLGRVGMAEEVAQAACYLAAASYVTGETVNVNGGNYVG